MLRCLIIEDEPLPAQILEEYIGQTPDLTLVGHCTDALFAIDLLKKETVDLIFLDIHLPRLKGLAFLNILKNPPLIVLTTAYHEYALEGYEHEVLDYLLKPIGYERFMQAVEKAQRKLNPVKPKAGGDYVFFNVNRRQVKVHLADILYIESLKDYSCVHTATQRIVTQVTLSEMEQLLPPTRFTRVHRSFMINLRQVTAYNSSEVELGAIQIPIGKSFSEKFSGLLAQP